MPSRDFRWIVYKVTCNNIVTIKFEAKAEYVDKLLAVDCPGMYHIWFRPGDLRVPSRPGVFRTAQLHITRTAVFHLCLATPACQQSLVIVPFSCLGSCRFQI